jgi:hypothetical protein
MANIDVFKSSLAAVDSTTVVKLQLGPDGTTFQISAGELLTALGLPSAGATLAAPTPATTPTATSSTSAASTGPRLKKLRVKGDLLRLRAQPTTAAAIVDQFGPGAFFDVFDETPVRADDFNWARTADGRGWIALDFTEPIEIGTSGVQVVATRDVPNASIDPSPSRTMKLTPDTGTPNWLLPFTASQRGVGTSAGGWAPDGRQCDLVRQNRVEFVLVCTYERNQASNAVTALRAAGVRSFILRACIHEPVTTAQRWVDLTVPVLKEYEAALGGSEPLMIAIHNEPNLVREGWTTAWRDGQEFAAWWIAVANAYRQAFPGAKMGFPAMSPGGDVPGIRMNEPMFVAGANAAVQDCDWVGIHYYWLDPNGSDINPTVDLWRSWFGNLPIVGTEVGPADANTVTSHAMRIAYDKFAVAGIPAVGWVLSGAGAWQNAAWDTHNLVI